MMSSNSRTQTILYGWLIVALLTFIFGAVNWHWLQANVVTYGWDRMDHLITSLAYNNIFRTLSPASLFEALAFADYYPPLVHFGIVAAYKVFGVNEDIAAMTNVLYIALLLGSTWYVAKRVGGIGVAMLAMLIIGTFPMIYIMSRYLYLDFALTAMVAVSLALLLATERFTRRVPSLLFGVALGLTFLVKWTAAAFLAAPLIYVLWQSGVIVGLIRNPVVLRPNVKRLLIAFGISAVVMGAWLWSARASVEINPLGWALLPLFVLLFAGVVYAVSGRGTQGAENGNDHFTTESTKDTENDKEGRGGAGKPMASEMQPPLGTTTHPLPPSEEGEPDAPQEHVASPVPLGQGNGKYDIRTRITNALSAGAVGAFVMALWYGLNTEFIAGFFYTAYGREEGRFLAFDKYFYEVVTEQIGPFYATVLAVIVLLWLVRYGFSLRKGERINAQTATHFLTPSHEGEYGGQPQGSPQDTIWVLLSWAIVPYIIFSAGVSLAHSRFLMPFLPPLAVAIAAGLWQVKHALLRIACCVLVVGIAIGQFAILSFDSLEAWRDRFIVSTPNRAINLLAQGFFIQYPAAGDTDPGYAIAPEILERAEQARLAQGREYINVGVLVNSHQLHEKHFLYQIYIRYPNVLLRELARNWSEHPAYAQIFEMDYVLVSDTHSYRTSTESQAVINRLLYDESDLFNQAFRPIQEWEFLSGEQVTLYERRFAPTTPGTVVEDYQALVQAIGGELSEGDGVLLVAPDQAYMVGLTFPDGTGAKYLPLDSADSLASATEGLERLFLLSYNAGQTDPTGAIEGWLRANAIAGGDQWFNGVRLTPFVHAVLPDTPASIVNAEWETGTVLEGVATQTSDSTVTARVFWNAPDTTSQKVSLQLLAPDGALIAQQDADLVNGIQSFALLIPRALQGSDYQLIVALYDPTSLERYNVAGGGDTLLLPLVMP
jgi:4-amino-4-deoxy-L-arabinose transferase-like glycosyltransferase